MLSYYVLQGSMYYNYILLYWYIWVIYVGELKLILSTPKQSKSQSNTNIPSYGRIDVKQAIEIRSKKDGRI